MLRARPSLGLPGLPACLAALCALLQVAGSLHYLLIEHRHCAEHGEAVHGDGHSASTPTSAPHVRFEHAGASVGASDDAEHAEHEHCAMTSDKRSRALVGAATMTLPAPAFLALGAPRVAAFAPAQTPLETAPKTSPPLAS